MAKYIVEIADEIKKDSVLIPFDMCRPAWWEEAYKQGMAEVESRIIHCRDCKWWERKYPGRLMATAMLASTISTPGIGRYTSQERTTKISIALMRN